MQGYSTCPTALGLELHHQIQFNLRPTTLNDFKYCKRNDFFDIIHVCTQFNGFKYSKRLNSSIWPIDGTPTVRVGLGVMAMKEYTTFRKTNVKVTYLGHSLGKGLTPCRDAACVFYCPKAPVLLEAHHQMV